VYHRVAKIDARAIVGAPHGNFLAGRSLLNPYACEKSRVHDRRGPVPHAGHRRHHRHISVVNAVLLRPLPYNHPEQLIRVYTEFPKFPNGGLHRFLGFRAEFVIFAAIRNPGPRWMFGPPAARISPEILNLFG